MKTKFFTLVFLLMVAGIMFTSCVSSKKFAASKAQVNSLQKENEYNKHQINLCSVRANDFNNERIALQVKFDSIQSEIISLSKFSNLIIDDQAKRLRSLNDMVFLQKEALNDLIYSLDEALMNYKADELSVYTKDGKVYVLLEEKMLYKSGSEEVEMKGKEALRTLAGVLNTSKDITVLIEGHTDNATIKNKMYKDNWDLSTARATSIVRILTDEYGFDPTRITASGKGKYQPVQINDTEEGRAANRRTEIILTPNLGDLYKVLYQ
jgi:chemotaxis protein MotB